MSGLLDYLKQPEGQGLLAAAFGGLAGARRGQPINSLGRAGLAGLAGYSGAQDRALQAEESAFNKTYKTMQLTKMQQEMAAAQERSNFLKNLSGAPTAALTAGAQEGDLGPTKTNAARMDGLVPPALQRIPQSALQAEIALNGGKNIPEWMFKTGMPDMQVSNGYAYDKNNVQPGFMPQFSVSNDGKATKTEIGPDGQPVVSAPAGALATYGAYRNLDASTTAAYDTMPITLPDGTTVLTTRKDVVEGGRRPPANPATPRPSGNFTGTGYAGGSATTAANEQRLIMTRERQNAVAAGNTELVAALDREIARLPVASQSAAPSQGGGSPVPGIQVQSDGQKQTEQERIKSDAAAAAAVQKDRVTARKFVNQAKRAEALLLQNPTGSALGSMQDKVMGALGMTSESANTAQSLKAVSGWLVSNTPRMEGPQSNFDVENYKVMAADVGNDQLPVERRLAALREIMSMFEGVSNPTANADKPVENKPSQAFDAKPPAQQYKGKTMRGPDGKRYQSDGMIWKEVR